MSRYTRTVLSLIVANAMLVLFLTFGAVFPSRLAIPDAGDSMPDEFYDYTAKLSPFHVPAKDKKRAKVSIPVFSARSLPLLSSVRVEPQRSAYPMNHPEYPSRGSVGASSEFAGTESRSSVEIANRVDVN